MVLKHILVTDIWIISWGIALSLILKALTDDESTLVQVMSWCHQASQYLSQCCPSSMSKYGVIRPQWVNPLVCPFICSYFHPLHFWNFHTFPDKQHSPHLITVTMKITSPLTAAGKTHVGPVNLFFIIMFKIRKIKPNSGSVWQKPKSFHGDCYHFVHPEVSWPDITWKFGMIQALMR